MNKILTKETILLALLLHLTFPIFSQDSKKNSTSKEEKKSEPQQKEEEKKPLPFKISENKHLKEEEVKKKKEGWFPSGLPFLYIDANNGVGYGGRLILTNNNKRKDPFFEYTPYRHRIFIHYSNTTKNYQWHAIDLDSPYVLNTQWRFRGRMIYERNPNALFFGIGEKSLQGLSYHPYNNPNAPLVRDGKFKDQESAYSYSRPAQGGERMYSNDPLYNSAVGNATGITVDRVTDKKHNRYILEDIDTNMSVERSFFDGIVRTVVGSRFSKNNITTYDGSVYDSRVSYIPGYVELPTLHGKTKLTEDYEKGKIVGYNGGYVNALRFGLVFDTRDYEPDPTKGIFAEVTHERSMKVIGSDFEYNKTMGQAKFYFSPFAKYIDHWVFAGRVMLSNSRGSSPFFEYKNIWGTEETISGLGGRKTLRGFYQDRFVGPTMGLINLETRIKFYEVKTFVFSFAPFIECGRVWDDPKRINLVDYKYSYGSGLRLAWAQSTIIYLDVAFSKEGSALLYMNFNHVF